MASEVAAVSSAHLQQDLLAGRKSEFEFAATVFSSAPQVEKLKYLLQQFVPAVAARMEETPTTGSKLRRRCASKS